jgi:hypothetical protein
MTSDWGDLEWSYPAKLRKTGFRAVIELRRASEDTEPLYEAVAYLEPLPDGEQGFDRIRVAAAQGNHYDTAFTAASAAISVQMQRLMDAELAYGHPEDEDGGEAGSGSDGA